MFREKYRRDNELLRAPDQIPEEIMNMTQENKQTISKKLTMRVAAVATAACLLIVAVAAIPLFGSGRGTDLPLETVVSTGDLHSAVDYSEIYEALTDLREANGEYYAGFGVITDTMVEDAVVEEIESESSMDSFNDTVTSTTGAASDKPYYDANDYSQTNTQKQNVDEADIIKTDGQYIYRLTCGEVVIIDAERMEIVSQIQPGKDFNSEKGYFNASNIYVSGNRLMVMYNKGMLRSGSEWQYDSFAGVQVYDITDRTNPVQTGDFAQSGYLNDSRLIGDYVYMVTSYGVYSEIAEDQPDTYVPLLCVNETSAPIAPADVCILPEPSASTFAVITSVNIQTGTTFESTEATFGHGSTVYADTEAIVLAFSTYKTDTVETQEDGQNVIITTGKDQTDLVSYAIDNGSITMTAHGAVPGALLNQFSLDRHNGVLRVVTTSSTYTNKLYTDGIDRYEYENSTTNGLYTLDKGLNIIGALDGLAEDERVYSVRFSGDIGYFVTFRQVDPLFAVDLSDPENPTLLSALKIPGFSQYMHPYADGLLFGLGMDADENTGRTNGLKLSMFDINDPADVTEKHKLILKDIGYSEALYNHRAIVISAARDIIAFPAGNGYLIYGYGDEGFYERFSIELDTAKYPGTLRGLFIGSSFYICGDFELNRYDMDTFTLQDTLTIAEADEYYMTGYVIYD